MLGDAYRESMTYQLPKKHGFSKLSKTNNALCIFHLQAHLSSSFRQTNLVLSHWRQQGWFVSRFIFFHLEKYQIYGEIMRFGGNLKFEIWPTWKYWIYSFFVPLSLFSSLEYRLSLQFWVNVAFLNWKLNQVLMPNTIESELRENRELGYENMIYEN